MPYRDGSKDAVAVPQETGSQLIAAYTFMLEHIVLLVWGISVMAGLFISTRIYEYNHPSSKLHSQIWKKQSTPYGVLKLGVKHFIKPKSSRWAILLWVLTALSFVVVNYAVPIIFAPYIRIGSAAPVNPDAIFVPSTNGTEDNTIKSNIMAIQKYRFDVASSLRAAAAVDGANDTVKAHPPVTVTPPDILQRLPNGETIMRVDYHYNVTGLDLGLQNFATLGLFIEGSCVTEYGWYNMSLPGGTLGQTGTYVDRYRFFLDDNYIQDVSRYDGGPPTAFFQALSSDDDAQTNLSWGAIISSVNRTTFGESNDPWYRTGPNASPQYNQSNTGVGAYMVRPARPALSCWENSVWSYKGHNSSISRLDSIPGLNMPIGLQTILFDYLGLPMIANLGLHLRSSALKSSLTALSNNFDALTSSLHADLERLVFASYIATVNCLTETTLYPSGINFLNDIKPNNILLDGVSDFVVFSNDVVTLSVKSLIIIPTVAVTLWVIFLLLLVFPAFVKMAKELKAIKEEEPEQQEAEGDEKGENIIKAVVEQVLGDDKGDGGGDGDAISP
jgi:hypothetical protein